MVIRLEKDEEKKKAMTETALKETVPYYLTRLEAIVQKNKGYLALGRVRECPKFWKILTLLCS
jgi:glutathione S-transferase